MFLWQQATEVYAEDFGDEDFKDIDHVTDIPIPTDPDTYASAKSKPGSKQADNNVAACRGHARLGSFPNINTDPNFAYLAHRDEISASVDAALKFAKVTLPKDKARSRVLTDDKDKRAGFGSARAIFEDEVRKRALVADSPTSKPGVYRELLAPEKEVYEQLLSHIGRGHRNTFVFYPSERDYRWTRCLPCTSSLTRINCPSSLAHTSLPGMVWRTWTMEMARACCTILRRRY